MISLVTGHTGTEHVTSKQVGKFNAALHGKGNYILDVGDKCQVDVIDSNKIRINKGELMCQGRHISIESPEEITITGGTLGQTTYALVYIHYSIDDSGIESVSLQTKALTSADNYDLSGSILDGSSTADIELVRVSLNGYSISKAELLLQVLQDSEKLKKEILNTMLNESLRIVNAKTQGDVKYFRFNNGLEIEVGKVGFADVKISQDGCDFVIPYKYVENPIYANLTSNNKVNRNVDTTATQSLWFTNIDCVKEPKNIIFYCAYFHESMGAGGLNVRLETGLNSSCRKYYIKYLVIGYSGD